MILVVDQFRRKSWSFFTYFILFVQFLWHCCLICSISNRVYSLRAQQSSVQPHSMWTRPPLNWRDSCAASFENPSLSVKSLTFFLIRKNPKIASELPLVGSTTETEPPVLFQSWLIQEVRIKMSPKRHVTKDWAAKTSDYFRNVNKHGRLQTTKAVFFGG